MKYIIILTLLLLSCSKNSPDDSDLQNSDSSITYETVKIELNASNGFGAHQTMYHGIANNNFDTIIVQNAFSNSIIVGFGSSDCNEGQIDIYLNDKIVSEKSIIRNSVADEVSITIPTSSENPLRLMIRRDSSSNCKAWSASFDIEPSSEIGKVLEVEYSIQIPHISTWVIDGFAKGVFYADLLPYLVGDIITGDTVSSKCKLTNNANDSLIMKVHFNNNISNSSPTGNLMGNTPPIGLVDIDSSTLANFIGTDSSAKVACGLYYQTWKTFAPIQDFNYSRTADVKFKNSPPIYRIDTIMGKKEILSDDPNGNRYKLFLAKNIKTGENLFLLDRTHTATKYGSMFGVAKIDSSYFAGKGLQDADDFDSITVVITPYYILSRENEYHIKLIDSVYTKCLKLKGSWCSDETSFQSIDSIVSSLVTKNGETEQNNWIWTNKFKIEDVP